jgi:hypothetical protein
MCDASGAVALGAERFAIADDEDNVLRVYDAEHPGGPLYAIDVSAALGLAGKHHVREADIEAATRIGEYALWITSHGLSSHGKHRAARFRFFATNAPSEGVGLGPVGQPYEALLDDMVATPVLAPFALDVAAQQPPKSPGGLNIEGLTERADGKGAYIGFRNPRPGGRALLVTLRNPLEVVAGARAEFGEPELLDLGGLGIRAIGRVPSGGYLISAGSYAADSGEGPQLYRWLGPGQPVRRLIFDLRDFSAEALVIFPERPRRVLLLSDDGERKLNGERCKDLGASQAKQFRGRWFDLPDG